MKFLILLIYPLLHFFSVQSQIVQLNWVKSNIARETDQVIDAEIDSKGNIVYAGFMRDSADLYGNGKNYTPNNGNSDVYIVKARPDGSVMWIYHFGSFDHDDVRDIHIDGNDDIYVIGRFKGSVDFNNDPIDDSIVSTNAAINYILKIKGNGSFDWVRTLGHYRQCCVTVERIVTDKDDNFYLTGSTLDSVDFSLNQSPNFVRHTGNVAAYILKSDKDANVQWIKTLPSESIKYHQLAIGQSNVYFACSFSQEISASNSQLNDTLFSKGQDDLMISKISFNGNVKWLKQFNGSVLTEIVNDMKIDGDNNILLTINLFDSLDIDLGMGKNILAPNTSSSVILKYDSSANLIWHYFLHEHMNDNYVTSSSMYLDDKNNVYTTGNFYGRIDFNASKNTSDTFYLQSNASGMRNGMSFYVLKTSDLGKYMWVKSTDMKNTSYIFQIVGDGNLSYYLAGFFADSLDFQFSKGTHLLTSIDHELDGFIAKYSEWPLSVDEETDVDDFGIYPNPNNGWIYFKGQQNLKKTCQLFELSGQLVLEKQCTSSLDITELPNGFYMLKVIQGQEQEVFKIIKN